MAGLCFFARLNKCVTTAPLIAEAERISAMDGGRPAEKINVNMANKINTISIREKFLPQENRESEQIKLRCQHGWIGLLLARNS